MVGVGAKMMEGRSHFSVDHLFQQILPWIPHTVTSLGLDPKPPPAPTTVHCTRNKGTVNVRVPWNIGEPATQSDALNKVNQIDLYKMEGSWLTVLPGRGC